jgi:hypothetical protein
MVSKTPPRHMSRLVTPFVTPRVTVSRSYPHFGAENRHFPRSEGARQPRHAGGVTRDIRPPKEGECDKVTPPYRGCHVTLSRWSSHGGSE